MVQTRSDGSVASPYSSVGGFERALAALPVPDSDKAQEARKRQAELAKPRGSLGRLEELAVFMAGWQRCALPFIARGQALIFAGNHGLWQGAPATTVTAGTIANVRAGGAAINALARVADLELDVCPLELDLPTADFARGPAMTPDECLAALSAGAAAIRADIDLLVLGDIGIGSLAAAAALCARSLGGTARDWVGVERRTQSIEIVDRALACHADAPRTAFETLRRLGGRESAAIAGAILHARALRVPVVLDGFACCAALAVLAADQPAIAAHCIVGHCSTEPGHARLLERLDMAPLLQLDLALGEGSGAALAVGIIRSALAAHSDMATLSEIDA